MSVVSRIATEERWMRVWRSSPLASAVIALEDGCILDVNDRFVAKGAHVILQPEAFSEWGYAVAPWQPDIFKEGGFANGDCRSRVAFGGRRLAGKYEPRIERIGARRGSGGHQDHGEDYKVPQHDAAQPRTKDQEQRTLRCAVWSTKRLRERG